MSALFKIEFVNLNVPQYVVIDTEWTGNVQSQIGRWNQELWPGSFWVLVCFVFQREQYNEIFLDALNE